MKLERYRTFALSILCVAVLFGESALCSSQNANGNPTLASGFANPPQSARPQVRFWIPGAAVTDTGLRGDIDAFAQRGFGGFEIVAMGLPKNVGPEFQWGTDAWNRLMTTVATQAGKDGITVDFTNGPRWPVAMPNIKSADDPGALYEMTYGSVVVQPGQLHTGVVPPRRKVRHEGTTKLDAVLAYRLTAEKTLDASSIIDLTAKTRIDSSDNANSSVDFTAPAGSDPWILFSFWEQPADQKTDRFYVIDHFGGAGAKASNDYWENIALPVLGDNIKNVRSIFNDSLEYEVSMEWTRGMLDIYKLQHGYDITPYLPFIGISTTYPADDVPGYKATDNDLAQKVEHDYRETLTALYIHNHLQPMEQMAERHGLTVRCQVAYNKPMQIEDSAVAVGIPETEALARSSIDMQRYMAGAVHLTGKPFYSIETSAELFNAYGQSLQDIVWWSKRAWAAGVNMQHLHGESYSGQFNGPANVAGQLPGQKWPGYSAFANIFSNNWTRQTSPDALHEVLTYMARMNYVLQKKAKVDVAVYDDSHDIFNNPSFAHGDGNAVYPDGGVLNAAGFNYDFVSPALLDLRQASVTNGHLDSDGPAYKALIIHHEAAMTMQVVQRLTQLATQGLRIVFVGDSPRRNSSYADQLRGHSDADIRAAIASLLKLPTAATVAEYAAVPETLRRLGIRADAEAANPADILTQHRTDASGDYYYLYNYNKNSNADATSPGRSKDHTKYPDIDKTANFTPKMAQFSLAGTGRPYLLNAWTGKITPIPQFTISTGRVNVTVHLVGDEAMLIVLLEDQHAKRDGLEPATVWVTESDVPFGDLTYTNKGDLAVKTTRIGSYTIRLNTGRTVTPKASDLQTPETIQNWSLTIDSIEAPANGSTLFQDSVWRTLGPFNLGSTLDPWSHIDPSLARVSGVGTYKATFTLKDGRENGGGAYLDLGVLDDSFTVTINGKQLQPQDQVKTLVDMGQYVKSGVNTLEVQVATTLYNKVVGAGKLYGVVGNGGTVTVVPYRITIITPRGTKNPAN